MGNYFDVLEHTGEEGEPDCTGVGKYQVHYLGSLDS